MGSFLVGAMRSIIPKIRANEALINKSLQRKKLQDSIDALENKERLKFDIENLKSHIRQLDRDLNGVFSGNRGIILKKDNLKNKLKKLEEEYERCSSNKE